MCIRDSDCVLRTSFLALATGFALIGVNVSQIVFQRDSLERTNLHTLAATDTCHGTSLACYGPLVLVYTLYVNTT